MKTAFFTTLACVLVLAVIAAGVEAWRLQENTPDAPGHLNLTLGGMREIFLEYGQEYEEPGATAQLIYGKTVTEVSVEIQGQVDSHRLGDYILKYTAQKNSLICTDYRRVHVVDTISPVITLVKIPTLMPCPTCPIRRRAFPLPIITTET